jgi:hypothetical protein
MNQFGLIGEGITDQNIIEKILISYFSNPDLLVTYLQPLRDETNSNLATTSGNWDKVFEYCGSDVFKDSFQRLDYLVIQIDSDVFSSGEVPAKYRNKLLSSDDCETVIEKVKGFLIESIGEEFYTEFEEKIIFAIAVDSIECWLLPLYYSNKPAKAGKISGCLNTLNQVLPQQEGFYIDSKNPKYYQKIARKIIKMNKREFGNYATLNPSLQVFVSSLAHITE